MMGANSGPGTAYNYPSEAPEFNTGF